MSWILCTIPLIHGGWGSRSIWRTNRFQNLYIKIIKEPHEIPCIFLHLWRKMVPLRHRQESCCSSRKVPLKVKVAWDDVVHLVDKECMDEVYCQQLPRLDVDQWFYCYKLYKLNYIAGLNSGISSARKTVARDNTRGDLISPIVYWEQLGQRITNP